MDDGTTLLGREICIKIHEMRREEASLRKYTRAVKFYEVFSYPNFNLFHELI